MGVLVSSVAVRWWALVFRVSRVGLGGVSQDPQFSLFPSKGVKEESSKSPRLYQHQAKAGLAPLGILFSVSVSPEP